ncbi:hypothetical protein P154DRAFT_582275 [Amniculicola lignicola CBS 123094]|uniref:Uncharacterized protein n=1 Tax=Amniculicola lignicola CBS 123094 TaxID=1392246 RepID=A0A6A5VYB6_9PLEO|nr:hypothetical protein P154DRAFT_582275 [Amniculicola lignicola CBS 123094]
MPPGDEAKPQNRKRKRIVEAVSATDAPQPTTKRRRGSRRQAFKTPPEFWDSLSQVPLCRRALREFNRRAVLPSAPEPPARSALEGDLVKQLERFARHGGPSLRDIRGYPEPEPEAVRKMSSSQSRPGTSRTGTGTGPSNASSRTTPRTRISSKDAAFEQGIIDADIHPYNRGPKPNEWKEINERLAQPRPSLSPSRFSEGAFEKFQLKNDEARSEDQVKSEVIPLITGETSIPSVHNRLFTNLATMTNDATSAAKPDYYDGSRPAELNQCVRNALKPYIVPSKRLHEPLLPNFFTEVKGPDGKASEMRLQAAYDAAHGARAMLEIQSYGQNGYNYDGNAYTLASTYHSGTGSLKMYAMHPTEPAEPDGKPQYHMTQLDGYDMTGNRTTHLAGRRAYRNGRELAEEYRKAAIARANEKANEMQDSAPASSFATEVTTLVSEASLGGSQSQASLTVQNDSETSTDELADANPPAKRSVSKTHRSSRQKRNTGGSNAQQSSSVATAQSEEWSWANGAFQCFQGQTLVKSQAQTPPDVWVYFDQTWPGEGGKKWRRWLSVTNQMEYH